MVSRNQSRKRKRYTKVRYQPLRKTKNDLPRSLYSDKQVQDYYIRHLSTLLPNVSFSTSYYDLGYVEKDINIKINIPNNSGLHNLWYRKHIYDCVILTINYEFYMKKYGHVSLVLIDTNNKIIEWFDTSDTEPCMFDPVISKIKEYLPDYEIVKVNTYYIQEDENDIYCQTWIYYYVWKRLYKKKDYKSIIDKIMSKDKKSRTDVIRKFHYKITK